MRVLCLLLLMSDVVLAGEVRQTRDPGTGLLSWEVQHPTFSLQLIQLLPDFVAAVYSSRGLPPELIAGMADYCVFGTIVRNESQQPVSYRVAEWRYVTSNGHRHALKTKTEWLREWAAMGVPYRWSILPDEQTFQPGDWSQGFTTVALPAGSSFDLVYSWRHENETHQGVLEGLRCAPAQAPGR